MGIRTRISNKEEYVYSVLFCIYYDIILTFGITLILQYYKIGIKW
jgi:hypothetical protein